MITGNTLKAYKKRLLIALDERFGIEVKERYLLDDVLLNLDREATREHVVQALDALRDDGYASRRVLEFDGVVWKITQEGHAAAQKLLPS